MFDFMVYDRTNDNSTMLDTLETSDENILLCITTTTDKAFKEFQEFKMYIGIVLYIHGTVPTQFVPSLKRIFETSKFKKSKGKC